MKNQILKLNNNLNSLNEYIRELKARDKESNKFYDSFIVKEDESQMICNWINPNKEIKVKLLYRVSRDGDGPDIFHKYCDNKGPSILFAKISNGYRFGGFSGISWNCNDHWIKDKDAFLF